MSFALLTYFLLVTTMLVMKAAPSDLPSPGFSSQLVSSSDAVDGIIKSTPEPAFAALHDRNQDPIHIDLGMGFAEDINGAAILPHADDYLAFEITGTQTLVQRRGDITKRQAQIPAYRGLCKMRCKKNPQACQNACYYQNCIRDPTQGSIYYYEPGPDSATRREVGATTSHGTPCRTWPFGQKFWDPRARLAAPATINLQCDEWPMDQQRREAFQPFAAVPQYSLRCMPGVDNAAGASHVKNFRYGTGAWKIGGEFQNDRMGGRGIFVANDWYDIEFLLDDFDMSDITEVAIFNTLGYCQPNPDCTNDGLQFYATNVRPATMPDVKEGVFYDNARHSTYRMTSEPADIQQFHIWLQITGNNNDQVEAQVHVLSNGQQNVLVNRPPSPMALGTYFELGPTPGGILRQNIRVHRDPNNCMLFTFTYGYPISTTQPWRSFTFKSDDGGWTNWSPTDGDYCVREDTTAPVQPGQQNQRAHRITTLKCTFPGW